MTISNSKMEHHKAKILMMFRFLDQADRSSSVFLCVSRFFRDFFLLGGCKVDQQNACTSKIPIIAPQLSIPTSLTEGPRASTKD